MIPRSNFIDRKIKYKSRKTAENVEEWKLKTYKKKNRLTDYILNINIQILLSFSFLSFISILRCMFSNVTQLPLPALINYYYEYWNEKDDRTATNTNKDLFRLLVNSTILLLNTKFYCNANLTKQKKNESKKKIQIRTRIRE